MDNMNVDGSGTVCPEMVRIPPPTERGRGWPVPATSIWEIPDERNSETGAAKKGEKNSDTLDTGEGAYCYNRRHAEPGVVPSNFKWEIPVG